MTSISPTLNINTSNIGLTGHSMGGTGTWQIALSYPDKFSAVAPLSGSVKLTNKNISKLKNTPVWAIVGNEDTIVSPSTSINFINELKTSNSNAKITILDGYDHFEVPNAYLETDVINWLITQ